MKAMRLAFAVPDSDLQVIGGGHPEPEIRRGLAVVFDKIMLFDS